MSADKPFVLAVPSKGRLQENAFAFFARAGLKLVQGGGSRDYRGRLAGFDGLEIAFLPVSEIVTNLGEGAAHLGVAGEDVLREAIPDTDRSVAFLSRLGFGKGQARRFEPCDTFVDLVGCDHEGRQKPHDIVARGDHQDLRGAVRIIICRQLARFH